MSEYTVKLPDVGEGIAEAEIVEWHVNVGDVVAEDQLMVEVMTDKATVELPSPVAGTVMFVGAAVGDVLQVGAPLIRIDTGNGVVTDEDERRHGPSSVPARIADTLRGGGPCRAPHHRRHPRQSLRQTTPQLMSPAEPTEPRSAPTAAPAVRQRAKSLGVDLGISERHRPRRGIVHADLDAHLSRTARRPASTRIEPGDDDDRRRPRDRTAPEHRPAHGSRQDTNSALHLRRRSRRDRGRAAARRAEPATTGPSGQTRLTLLPLLMRAVVVAIREFPQMNARLRRRQRRDPSASGRAPRHRDADGEGIDGPGRHERRFPRPVVFAAEVTRLSTAARENKITLAELSGSTITISSLGSLGGIVSTPIINYPEVGDHRRQQDLHAARVRGRSRACPARS